MTHRTRDLCRALEARAAFLAEGSAPGSRYAQAVEDLNSALAHQLALLDAIPSIAAGTKR